MATHLFRNVHVSVFASRMARHVLQMPYTNFSLASLAGATGAKPHELDLALLELARVAWVFPGGIAVEMFKVDRAGSRVNIVAHPSVFESWTDTSDTTFRNALIAALAPRAA